MKKPSLNTVVHINFIEYNQYIEEKNSIPKVTLTRRGGNRDANYYDLVILDSHMFRGNDSSKNFYNQFMNESFDISFKHVFSFLDSKILDIVCDPNLDANQINKEILKISEKEWIEAYICVIKQSQSILDQLGPDNEYWLSYFIGGLFESAVLSAYSIADSDNLNKYFWYLSW